MNYKIKGKRVPKGIYWREREGDNLIKKYPNKIPPSKEIIRYGMRSYWLVQKKVHTKGTPVQYKEYPAVVTKVERNGVWLQTFKSDNENILKKDKEVFVTEKDIEAGKVYPYYLMTLA